ncbi:MAG: elongation factor Ts [Candidatus Omnitrophica bacterium]|nr:elongation factor Ts [Candidatus Omnitrophota bacterium]
MSFDLIKDLRERTGAGIMDCKAALASSGNDLEKAIDFLRKKGVAQAAKRAGRQAKEGLVWSRVEGNRAVIVEVNSETDFVARTDEFRNLTTLAANETLAHGESAIKSPKITQAVTELSGKIGEKIVVRRAKIIQARGGALFTYIHSNHKLGVVVEIASAGAQAAREAGFHELGKNIAMQVAAANPLCLKRSEVPPGVLEREKAIFREEVKGKPENIIEKIVQGKLEKFYATNCLLEQPFIKDDKLSVQALLDGAGKKWGSAVEVRQFVRFEVGETVTA